MAFYWRLKDIPELRNVAARDRRRWWREAATRSHTTRGMFAVMCLYFAAIVSADVMAGLFGYPNGLIHLGSMFVGVLLAGIVNDHWLVQPRARQWLRMHVDSDGIYIETESMRA